MTNKNKMSEVETVIQVGTTIINKCGIKTKNPEEIFEEVLEEG